MPSNRAHSWVLEAVAHSGHLKVPWLLVLEISGLGASLEVTAQLDECLRAAHRGLACIGTASYRCGRRAASGRGLCTVAPHTSSP